MGREGFNTPTKLGMKDSLLTVLLREKANTKELIIPMKAHGKMEKCMGLAKANGEMTVGFCWQDILDNIGME
jgi:hypothetical protein